MSIVAGILNRRRDLPLDVTLWNKLRSSVSRNPHDEVVAFSDGRVALFKVDVGAYGEPGYRAHSSGSISMLAGEPLLDPGPDEATSSRRRDLERMHDALDREEWSLFAKTQGVFCAVHYEPVSETVTLVADRLGMRPMYYWIGQEYAVFASALRILESLSEVPKSMDVVAVTEIVMLEMPIGGRTAYAGINALRPGTILRMTPDRVRSHQYWRWDSIRPSSQPETAQLDEAYSRFRKAVRRRLGRDTSVFATLSGGLDSRCVVAALRGEAVEVNTLNFYATLQSQDQVFAAEFAREAGTHHRAVSGSGGGYLRSFEQRATESWRVSPPDAGAVPERPQLLWKGDGGSVGVGHVYMEPDVVEALRARPVDEAIRAYRSRLVPRLLKSSLARVVAELIEEDVRAEMEDLRFDDPARSFHVLLMLNEQRHSYTQHFEDLDLHRVEFHQPFFDGDFLASIISVPVDLCLAHGFYTDWLSRFPPAVTSVPWQAYPGHRPCPVPTPAGLPSQWDTSSHPAADAEARRRDLLRVAGRVLAAERFPDAILDKRYLQLARWMGKAGLRRGQSTIAAAEIYERYWAASSGEFAAGPAQR